METRGLRYFIGFIIVIGLLIFMFVLLFGGNDSKSKVPNTSKPLISYANSNSEVRMSIDGPTNAAKNHHQVLVSVDQNRVLFQEKQGYDGTVVHSEIFGNSHAAYASFLRALEHANFTKGDVANMKADERGYCPFGNRYVFELLDSGKNIQRFWTNSCGSPKTYLGGQTLTIDLFQKQVPDYSRLVENDAL